MRIISVRTIKNFIDKNPITENPLKAWVSLVKQARWSTPQDIINDFGVKNIDTFKNNRVCFDVAGNHIRIIVGINYDAEIVYVKFIGWHKDYDKIDPETVEMRKTS